MSKEMCWVFKKSQVEKVTEVR